MLGRALSTRVEDSVHAGVGAALRSRGWRPRVLPFTGYGGPEHARVLARVVLSRADARPDDSATPAVRRGFRMFFAAPVPGARVEVGLGAATAVGVADRGGCVDVTLDGHGLEPGWHEARLTLDGVTSTSRVQVIDAEATFGIISDIDDTCLVTMLPRPVIAGYNSFVVRETARRVVPGMAAMYRSLLVHHPGSPVIYLSTGAWNAFPILQRFLRRHGYPEGALLLTDWGPTPTAWFRNGPAHKQAALDRLTTEFPRIRWLLVGDDGQRDPQLYDEIARRRPDSVAAIAIRRLTAAQQLLAHGSLLPASEGSGQGVPVVDGPDGYVLFRHVTHALRTRERATGVPDGPREGAAGA